MPFEGAQGRRVRANGSPGCLHKASVVVEMSVGRAISTTVSLELTGLITQLWAVVCDYFAVFEDQQEVAEVLYVF